MYIGQVVVISKKTSFFSHCVFLFRISLSDPSVVPVVRVYERMSCEESKNIVYICIREHVSNLIQLLATLEVAY